MNKIDALIKKEIVVPSLFLKILHFISAK